MAEDSFDPDAYMAKISGPDAAPAFDPDAYMAKISAQGKQGSGAVSAIQAALRKVDSYTGAPSRAAIAALQDDALSPGKAWDAAKAQFGQDPTLAPTGQDIVERAGVPKGSTAARALGFGMDVASNPTSYIPLGDIIGAGAKGAGRLAGILPVGLEGAADAAPLPAAAANAAKDITDIPAALPGRISRGAGLVGETVTGVDRGVASNYAANTDRINQIISHYKGPEGYAEAAHAGDIRNQWQNVIQGVRKTMNDQISSGLDTPEASVANINAKSIFGGIDSAIGKANPVTQAKDVETLSNLKNTLGKLVDDNGNISLKNLHAFKQYAAGVAEPAYDAAGNAIFPNGSFAAKMAKGTAGDARQILIQNAPQKISDAESTLADLHHAEDTMNSTLMKDNAPVHAINRAGLNPNGIEAKSLTDLKNITGYNFAQDAKDFATARQFASPKFTPEFNGKSVLRAGIGAGLVGAPLHYLGVPAEYAAAIGAGTASPAALKAGLNVSNLAGKGAALPIAIARGVGSVGYDAMRSPVGRRIVDAGLKGATALQAEQGALRSVANQPPIGKAHGGIVHGRAKVAGDSRANDTVPIMASAGEGIIPRSHMVSREKAHAFIDELFKKKPHMSNGGIVPSEGETLGSTIGYPGFPKPKAKGMAHGGIVKLDPSVSKYAKERGISYEDARRYLMSSKKKGNM